MAELRLEHVTYLYGAGTPFEMKALDDITLAFAPGRITGLLGHTGSGKSTLAQMLNGILRPTSGKVYLDGEEIGADKKSLVRARSRVGLVFQYPEYQLFEETVEKDIAFGPKNLGKTDEEIRTLTADACRFTGVEEKLLSASPFDLSGGQKRRVAIAGVLAMDPEILVLDEPAAGLDPGGREEIFGGLRAYQREKGKTVILISHSMEDMARYADEAVILKRGALFAHDSVASVFENAELIREAGLELPQITRLMRLLAERGVHVSPAVHTAEDAFEEIRARLKGGA